MKSAHDMSLLQNALCVKFTDGDNVVATLVLPEEEAIDATCLSSPADLLAAMLGQVDHISNSITVNTRCNGTEPQALGTVCQAYCIAGHPGVVPHG